jgi:hypothetical protein
MLELPRFQHVSLAFRHRSCFVAMKKTPDNRANCEFVAQHGSVGLLPDEQDWFTSGFRSLSAEIMGFVSKYVYHGCFVLTCFRQPRWLAKPSCSQPGAGQCKRPSLSFSKWSLRGLLNAPSTVFQSTWIRWRNLSIRLYFTNNSLTQTLIRSLSAPQQSLYLVSNQNVAGEI